MNTFKELLKEQFKDLSEESLETVHKAFESAVEDRAKLIAESNNIKKEEEFNTKIEEFKNEIDADHTDKLEKLVEAIDQDHAFKFEASLAKIDEKHASMLEEAIQSIDEDHAEKMKTVVEHIDEQHTIALQKVVEAIDQDHSGKFQQAIEAIDEKHTAMLETVIEKYETLLKEEATAHKEGMINDISDYLDVYLEKHIPTTQISEAVDNIKSKRTLDQIRDLVSISEEYIDNEVKEALLDGKKTIDSLKKELNEAMKAKVELNKKLNQTESAYLLEQKTQKLASATKAHVNKLLKNKSPEFIQENFQYVVEMFEKDIADKDEDVKESVLNRRIVESIDRPEITDEAPAIVSNPTRQSLSPVGGYLNEMQRKDSSKLRLTR